MGGSGAAGAVVVVVVGADSVSGASGIVVVLCSVGVSVLVCIYGR
jgi:hypothetical protein